MGAGGSPYGGGAAGGGTGREDGHGAGPPAAVDGGPGPGPGSGAGAQAERGVVDADGVQGPVAEVGDGVRDGGGTRGAEGAQPAGRGGAAGGRRDGDPFGQAEGAGDAGVPGAGGRGDQAPERGDRALGADGPPVRPGRRAEPGDALQLPERGQRPPGAPYGPAGHRGVEDPEAVQMGLAPVDQPVARDDRPAGPEGGRVGAAVPSPVHGHGDPQGAVPGPAGRGGGGGRGEAGQ